MKVDVDRWTADALVDVINEHTQRRGVRTVEPVSQRNPVGYLAALIRAAVDPNAETPVDRGQRIAVERDERLARRAEQRRADAERVAQIDRAEVARIISQMKADQIERDRMTAVRGRQHKITLEGASRSGLDGEKQLLAATSAC